VLAVQLWLLQPQRLAQSLVQRPPATHGEGGLRLAVPYPFDKCIGILPMNEVLRQPEKAPVGQLADGSSKHLQRLAVQLGTVAAASVRSP
jgi:hypothetical protein